MAYQVKRGETARPLRAQLVDANGPIPIAGANVEFHMRSTFTPTIVVGGACLNSDDGTDANTGRVAYGWTAADWTDAEPGIYLAEFKVTFDPGGPDESVEYIPNGEYREIEVLAAVA